jgi:chromosome partitioning protein
MQTVVLCGFKGGTARTSITLHLGSALAEFHKKKVLLIDFDPQANLSTGLGFGTDNLKTMVPVLQGEKMVTEVVQPTAIPGLSLIAANTFLDQIESTMPLVTDPYAHERLRKSLKGLSYDFCFIDIPPNLGWLCQSAFFAANHSLICSIPEPYSVLALNRLAKYHQAINENHSLSVLGVIFSMWDGRGATNQAFLDGVEAVFPGKVFSTRVRRDIAVSRAVLQGMPVFSTASSSRVSEDYRALAKEFLERAALCKGKVKEREGLVA